ncbi:MAG: hypothetical protein AB1611_09830 [bacterium]
MDILTKSLMNPLTESQKEQLRTNMARFQTWMEELRLEQIQKALSEVCGYDVSKFLGVIFGREQKKVLIPVPNIIKSYYCQEKISINEAKAYLVSLYIFKVCLNAKSYGLITSDPVFGESLYPLLKAKMGSILSSTDWEAINRFKDPSDLLRLVASRFLVKTPPFAVHLQREAKLIEIIDREDMLGLFINSMSARWVIQFMFSQGFFGLSLLCSVQLFLNAWRMAYFLRWAVGGLAVVSLGISAALFICSIIRACKDLAELDIIKSGYLKYLPQWLSPQALQRANQQIVPQFMAAEEFREAKKSRFAGQPEDKSPIQLFLFEMRKRIQKENPLIDEENLLLLIQEGLEKMHSWSGFQEFIKRNIKSDILPVIDRIVSGKKSLAQKIVELRRMIRSMSIRMPESQIRQIMIEGVKESQDIRQFQAFLVKRLQELGLTRKESMADRFARIFMFMD